MADLWSLPFLAFYFKHKQVLGLDTKLAEASYISIYPDSYPGQPLRESARKQTTTSLLTNKQWTDDVVHKQNGFDPVFV